MGLIVKQDDEFFTSTQQMVFLILKYAEEHPKILGDALISLALRSLLAEQDISILQKKLEEFGNETIELKDPIKRVKNNDILVNQAVERVLSTLEQVEEINLKSGGLN